MYPASTSIKKEPQTCIAPTSTAAPTTLQNPVVITCDNPETPATHSYNPAQPPPPPPAPSTSSKAPKAVQHTSKPRPSPAIAGPSTSKAPPGCLPHLQTRPKNLGCSTSTPGSVQVIRVDSLPCSGYLPEKVQLECVRKQVKSADDQLLDSYSMLPEPVRMIGLKVIVLLSLYTPFSSFFFFFFFFVFYFFIFFFFLFFFFFFSSFLFSYSFYLHETIISTRPPD